jgi:hypothetical protein
MEITGKVVHALEIKKGVSQRTGNPWMARDYVLEIPGQYEKHMVFTVFGEDRIKQFALRKDEEVTVHFDVDANEYQGKWYNKIQAYNITRAGQQAVAQQPPVATAPAPQESTSDNTDDLPF